MLMLVCMKLVFNNFSSHLWGCSFFLLMIVAKVFSWSRERCELVNVWPGTDCLRQWSQLSQRPWVLTPGLMVMGQRTIPSSPSEVNSDASQPEVWVQWPLELWGVTGGWWGEQGQVSGPGVTRCQQRLPRDVMIMSQWGKQMNTEWQKNLCSLNQ